MSLGTIKDKALALRIGIIVAIAAIAYIMLLESPMRLDDWTWGSSVGIDRLAHGFAGYNGRYLGNIVVILLTRLPAPIRALVELGVLVGIAYNSYLIVGRSKYAFAVSSCLFVLMPLPVLSQSITWTSGFANFAVSALFVVYLVRVFFQINNGKIPNRLRVLAICVITLLGQLLLENASIYIICLAAVFFAVSCARKTSGRTVFGLILIFAITGALIMFSNSSYASAAAGDGDTYKSISLLSGGVFSSVKRWIKTFCDSIAPNWLADCLPLCMTISFGATSLALLSRNKMRIPFIIIGLILLAIAVYSTVDPNWYGFSSRGVYFRAAYSIFLYLFSICIVYRETHGEHRRRILVLLASQLVLVGPLLFVSPIGPRCFLTPYVFWCLTSGLLIDQLRKGFQLEEHGALKERTSTLLATLPYVFVIVVLCLSTLGQSLSWHIYDLRARAIDRAVDQNVAEVVIPEVPKSTQYCFGANVANTNTYWIDNFKRYYDIPAEMIVTFCPYEDYDEAEYY